jgi:uncharacterized protein (TIGR02246 family)
MTVTTEVRDLVRRWAAAEQSNDPEALAGLLAADFAGVGPMGYVLTREQWLARFGDGLVNRAFTADDLTIREYGTAAVVIGVESQQTSYGAGDNSGSFRLTLVAAREDDRWVVANVHLGPLQAPPAPQTVSRPELQDAMAAGSVTVVDALPPVAFQRRHLPGAVNLAAEDIENSADLLPDREALIVVYSTDTTCTRGPDVTRLLTGRGYRNVRSYRDGIEDWVAAGLPVEAGPAGEKG